MRIFVISLLFLGLAACGGGNGEESVLANGAPSAEEVVNASASDLEEVAALLAGTYRSANTVTSNSCSNNDSSVGDVMVETVVLSQKEDNLVLTIEGSATTFKGKANGNQFTLVRETSFRLGSCSFEQKIIISGGKLENGSLEGSIQSTQKAEGVCGSQKSCESNETFKADPI